MEEANRLTDYEMLKLFEEKYCLEHEMTNFPDLKTYVSRKHGAELDQTQFLEEPPTQPTPPKRKTVKRSPILQEQLLQPIVIYKEHKKEQTELKKAIILDLLSVSSAVFFSYFCAKYPRGYKFGFLLHFLILIVVFIFLVMRLFPIIIGDSNFLHICVRKAIEERANNVENKKIYQKENEALQKERKEKLLAEERKYKEACEKYEKNFSAKEEKYKEEVRNYEAKLKEYLSEKGRALQNRKKLISSYSKEHEEEKEKLKKRIEFLDEQCNKYSEYIPNKYNDELYIEKLIEIFDDKRADSLKEAVNVLVSDMKADELINVQNRRLEEENRHNAEMEMYQRQSIRQKEYEMEETEKENERLRREEKERKKEIGGEQCRHCVHRYGCHTAGYNEGNCGGYVPEH